MGSSHVRPAFRTLGIGRVTATPPRHGGADRPRAHGRAPGRRRRADLGRAALWTLAIAAAVALNVMGSLKAHAAGGMLAEDTGQLKIDTSRQATADSKNLSALGPRSEKFGIKPYVRYGLTDSITMGLGSETRFVKSGLESDRAVRTDGFMDTEFFLRGRLRDQDWYKISVRDILRLPGQNAAPGLSRTDSSLRVQYGRSVRIGTGNLSSSIRSGFHPSFDHAPDKLQTDVSLGWRPTGRWQFTAQSINSVALDSGEGGGPAPSGIDSSIGQFSVARNLTTALSLQVGGWQTVSGGSGQPHGYDAIVWLRY